MKSKDFNNIIIAFMVVIVIILAYLFLFKKTLANSIMLNKNAINLIVGESFQLEATIYPKDTSNKEVIWTTDNPMIATVENGLVKAIKKGEVFVTASTKDGEKMDKCRVVVSNKEVQNIEIANNIINIEPGGVGAISVSIIPPDATLRNLNYLSNDVNIVTVDNEGKLTAVSEGITTVTITDEEEKIKKEVYVIVGVMATKIEINKEDLVVSLDEEKKLNVTITPENSQDMHLTYESSVPSVVEIDKDGIMTGKSLGTATIKVKDITGTLTDECTITVEEKKFEVIINGQTKIYKSGDRLGTLPTLTKDGYIFEGWYTKKTGGQKVTANTIVTDNMTLYPHWELTYVAPRDSRYNSYETIATCDSETFKYRIVRYQNSDIVIVWVANAAKQLKQGLASSNAKGTNYLEAIIAGEVAKRKCLVATNASLFEYGTPLGGVVIHDSKVIKNTGNTIAVMGITKDSELKAFVRQPADDLVKAGVVNTFVVSHTITPGISDGTKTSAHRTQICQIDKNNFAIISGNGTTNSEATKLHNATGGRCKQVFNLDGGGSRKLYYQTRGSGLIKRFGGDRTIPDVLYFAEQ